MIRFLIAFSALAALVYAVLGMVEFGANQFPDFQRLLAIIAAAMTMLVLRNRGA